MSKFRLEKKLVAQVRYYEYLYVIKDEHGERLYTGTDEKIARRVQQLLNAYYAKDATRKQRPKKRMKGKK